MVLPSKARQEELYAQVVLTIKNNHGWYDATEGLLEPRSWGYFRAICNDYRGESSGLKPEDIRYINICLLESRLGRKLVMSDFDYASGQYREDAKKYIAQYNQPEITLIKEETIMNTTNTPAFETKHFVFGADVNTLSADQLIDSVKKIENEVTALNAVASKSTYINNRVVELTEMLAKVVEQLDKK